MNPDLTFLIKSLKRRFPAHHPLEIHKAIEDVLEEMSPSRNRSILSSRVIHRLEASRDAESGKSEPPSEPET